MIISLLPVSVTACTRDRSTVEIVNNIFVGFRPRDCRYHESSSSIIGTLLSRDADNHPRHLGCTNEKSLP